MTSCGLEQTGLFQLGQKTLQGLGSKSGAELLFCSLADYRKGRLAIELLCACQGIDLLAPLKTGTISTQAYDAVRAESPKLVEDRPLAQELNAVSKLIATETFSTSKSKCTGVQCRLYSRSSAALGTAVLPEGFERR